MTESYFEVFIHSFVSIELWLHWKWIEMSYERPGVLVHSEHCVNGNVCMGTVRMTYVYIS